MRLRNLAFAALAVLATPSARAQEYRNTVNTQFNTVSSGPLQAIVVDVPAQASTAAVTQAVATRVAAVRKSREAALQSQTNMIRRFYKWRGELAIGVPDLVILRQNGRLLLPATRSRDAGPNDVLFRFPDASVSEPGAWAADRQDRLTQFVNLLKPQLLNVYGAPAWSGTVTIVDADKLNPVLSDRNALSGGVYNVSTNQILFAEYNHDQSVLLNLAQMMAIAFHGPDSISYDAWERGMARAATIVAVNALVRAGQVSGVDPSDPLWHALDFYDLLNQPALGNDRFFPVSKAAAAFGSGDFGGMIYPRLQMSGSAWLKVYVEDPRFFATFNAAYYQAAAADPAIKNNVPALKQIARTALVTDTTQPTVEGLDFLDWYQRQYVLDTSVSLGTKLYAWTIPVRPDAGADDYSMTVVLVYYRTVLDSGGNSDETPLNGTSFPIYWDYTYLNRLFLAPQYERIDVRDGQGTDAPVFTDSLGGDPALNSRMRVTMDFPINLESQRVYTAPRSMGTVGTPNNFWGTVVGADTGTMSITIGGTTQTVPVKQGAFGIALPTDAFAIPQKATLTFTDSANQTTTRRVNTGFREYASVFYASDPVTTRTSPVLPAGPAMISFPIQPLQPKAAQALLNPSNDQPLFTEGNLLMAQWRQDLSTDDKYLRYPSLGPLQPGRGYWSNFPSGTSVKIVGRTAAIDVDYSTGLLFGWNQIGNPYETAINVSDLKFQYLADPTAFGTADAVTKGWLGQNVPGLGTVVVLAYDPNQGYIPATTLQPWQGYWIRVAVSEGLTVTFPNPGRAARAASRTVTRAAAPLAPPDGWILPITLRDTAGLGSTAYLGQSGAARDGYDAKLDVQRPPDFTRAVPVVAFSHTDWGTNAGAYLTDIRRTGTRATWDISVYAPDASKTYTLSWGNLTKVPRTVRMVLVDQSTGQRQYIQGSSGYSFTPGNSPTRSFQIVAEDRTVSTLRILNLTARRTRAFGGSGVDIGFDLTQGATVAAEIRDGAGRVIRRLTPGRAADAGTNHLAWDARDDRAAAVPIGAYVVQVTARTPDGETTRAVQPVLVVR